MTTTDPHYILLTEILRENLNTPLCIDQNGKSISRQDLLSHALFLSTKLPDGNYAINLCKNRYFFIVSYLAVLLKNQITLLPPSQAKRVLTRLGTDYPESYYISDDILTSHSPCFTISNESLKKSYLPFPAIDTTKIISISFTSGSTGEPKAIKKNWQEFHKAAELALSQLNLLNQNTTLVSTVPTQHMYGLETSLFWPLFSSLSIHISRPFYPADIQNTLSSLRQPGILISTPAHLKACSASDISWSKTHLIVSSTAPLNHSLSKEIETQFDTPVFELFGSTETLSFASRRAHDNIYWKTYQSIQLQQNADSFFVSGGHLANKIKLNDRFQLHANGSFKLLGRATDLIKIAGKRASLIELNQILSKIDGIDDGVFIQGKNNRLSILVASKLDSKKILDELKLSIDEVFLPKKIIKIDKLPRNETGKIIKTELDQLINPINQRTQRA
ncbi:MAG: AMP-binding protein [Methylococcaceae bacterium]